MLLRDKLHLIIYRVREKGLEIFVREGEDHGYELPEAASELEAFEGDTSKIISLDSIDDDTVSTRGVAIEGDYHDIPSLKGLLLDDARAIRNQLRDLPTKEDGSFVAVKEIAKRLLPEQYRMLKELREILVDRNSTKYM